MDVSTIYMLVLYFFVLLSSILGAFNVLYGANLLQRLALFLLSIWSMWWMQVIYEKGYNGNHEVLEVTALAMFAAGTIQKTLKWRKR